MTATTGIPLIGIISDIRIIVMAPILSTVMTGVPIELFLTGLILTVTDQGTDGMNRVLSGITGIILSTGSAPILTGNIITGIPADRTDGPGSDFP